MVKRCYTYYIKHCKSRQICYTKIKSRRSKYYIYCKRTIVKTQYSKVTLRYNAILYTGSINYRALTDSKIVSSPSSRYRSNVDPNKCILYNVGCFADESPTVLSRVKSANQDMIFVDAAAFP